MRREFITTVMALALCAAILMGCGSSAESSASYEVPASVENIPASDIGVEEPALADAYQGEAEYGVDFGRPAEGECVPWDESEVMCRE